jgi:hypothetical protein
MEFEILLEIFAIGRSDGASGHEATNLVVDESCSKTLGQFVGQIDRRKHGGDPRWSSIVRGKEKCPSTLQR